jgi:hypothetical protein
MRLDCLSAIEITTDCLKMDDTELEGTAKRTTFIDLTAGVEVDYSIKEWNRYDQDTGPDR